MGLTARGLGISGQAHNAKNKFVVTMKWFLFASTITLERVAVPLSYFSWG